MKRRIRRPAQRKTKKKKPSERVGALNKKQIKKRKEKFRKEMIEFLKNEGYGYGGNIATSNN